MSTQIEHNTPLERRIYYGATDTGKIRPHNEDAFFPAPQSNRDQQLFIVADGMGGHNAGEIASQQTVDSLAKKLDDLPANLSQEEIRTRLIQDILVTHEEILEMGRANPEYRGMGCTLALAYIEGEELYACHVGDARIYHIRGQEMEQLGTDHSVVAQSLKAGLINEDEARSSNIRNQLTMAIGGPTEVEPEYTHKILHSGDIVLLCSDGLWDMVPEERIMQTIAIYVHAQQIVESLIEQANQAGGEDNITVSIFCKN